MCILLETKTNLDIWIPRDHNQGQAICKFRYLERVCICLGVIAGNLFSCREKRILRGPQIFNFHEYGNCNKF